MSCFSGKFGAVEKAAQEDTQAWKGICLLLVLLPSDRLQQPF